MSGFEVAGLVLGALPLVIQAFGRLKDNFQAAIHARIYIDKLTQALVLNQAILRQVVRVLLSTGGYDDFERLETNPFSCLEDIEAQNCLAKSLGPETFVFLEMMKQICSAVGNVARNISEFGPSGYESSSEDILLRIIKSNGWWRWAFRAKIRLLCKARDLQASIDEIDKSTKDLERLATVLSLNPQEAKQTPSQTVKKLSRGFRLVREVANNLYSALHRDWHHKCRYEHQITLRLDDRVDFIINALQYEQNNQGSLPDIDFQLLHTTTKSNEEWCHWLHIGVQPLEYKPRPGDEATVVTNVCAVIWNPKFSGTCGCLVLVENKYLNWITTQPYNNGESITEVSLGKMVTLRELLRTRGLGLPKLRCSLALRLSSNLLQLLKTPWLSYGFIQDIVLFPTHETQHTGSLTTDWDHPLILADFTSTHSTTPAMAPPNAKEILLELGIVLLELWHEETFEEKFSQLICLKSGFGRRECANKWFDESRHLLPRFYDKAVCHCLGGIIGGQVHLDWEDVGFWEAYCADIIGPLYRNCEPWLKKQPLGVYRQ